MGRARDRVVAGKPFPGDVAFSPGGDRLYMLSEMSGEEQDAELVSRDISEQALLENACRAAGRDLTAREWQAFVGGNPPSDLSCD